MFPKVRLVRRPPDNAQKVRAAVQVAFLLLNVWIGAQFYLFVRYVESGGQTAPVARPPGVEGWLPIAALMNLKYWVLTGQVPDVHPAGLFLLVAFLGMSLLLRKAFCSWLCPIGTLSEWLWQGGQALFGRTWLPPRWLDVPLRGLKYLLLAFFGYAVASMTPDAIAAFLTSPYGLVADVKMLNFFRHMGTTAAVVIGALLLLSVVVKNAWCRYLCPYGGLLGLVALVSPVGIRRTPDACVDCAKCAQACPSALPVDRLPGGRGAGPRGRPAPTLGLGRGHRPHPDLRWHRGLCPPGGPLARQHPRGDLLPARPARRRLRAPTVAGRRA
jgi:polyferredoxin